MGHSTQSRSRSVRDVANAEGRRSADVGAQANLELLDGLAGIGASAEAPAEFVIERGLKIPCARKQDSGCGDNR